LGKKHAETQVVIDALPQACFDALTDYETFPEWQDAMQSVDVVTRYSDGRGREVAFEIDAKVKSVNYTLEYSYEEPHRITWDYIGGDVKDVDGEYVLEDRGDGTTLATYMLLLDAGVWLPPPLAKVLREQVMKRSMEELKRRVESNRVVDQ
jgi:uncharacterized membrane protein